MSDQASTSDIAAFIFEVKRLLSTGKYDFVPRRKNMQALARHGLTVTDAKNEILGLSVGDYYKGPKEVSTNNCYKFMAIFIVFPGFCLNKL